MHSSDYYARLIAEVCVLLCDPEIQCSPAGALTGIAMQDLVHCFTRACAHERQFGTVLANEVAERYQQELRGRYLELSPRVSKAAAA